MLPFGAWTRAAQAFWSAGAAAGSLGEARLAALVRHARAHSPYYRDLYAGLPPDPPLESLPPTRRADLVARFDEWVTDPRITRLRVERFLADPARIGEPLLDGIHAWKSSGTSGCAGLYVQDPDALAVYDTLVAAQLREAPWGPETFARFAAGGGRAALVVATSDHFASIVSWERVRRATPWLEARALSVLEPLPRLVDALNALRPGFLSGYPSVLDLLAGEQAAGRLAIAPCLAWSGGERLTAAMRARIERAFGCAVMNEYGASECLSIAHECRAGWMHLHADWVILEGIDAKGRAVPPGQRSEGTLLTNLANRLQPLIRYALGDRVLYKESACECGSPLPAFRMEGREADTLEFTDAKGGHVRLAPLAIATLLEVVVPEIPFQVAQLAPARLAIRLGGPGDRGAHAHRAKLAATALREWLGRHGLGHVRVERQAGAPVADPRSGKVRAVVFEGARPP